MPPSGRWTTAGMVRGGAIDFAWVIHDSQHFGVAQRRRRLYAVCDFTGQRAAEILFKPKSLHRYFTQGGATRKGVAAYAQGSVNSAEPAGINPVAAFMGGQSAASRTIAYNEKVSPTLKSGVSGSNMIPCICEPQPNITELFPCDRQIYTKENNLSEQTVTVINDQGGDSLTIEKTEISPTLRSESHGNQPIISMAVPYMPKPMPKVYGICADNSNSMKSKNPSSGIYEAETARTIDQNCGNPACNQGGMAVVEPVCHPKITGTLCASGAGMSRPAGMCNETDLCIVTKQTDPNPAVCGTLCAKSIAPNGICNETDMCILQQPQAFTHLGFGHFAESNVSKTILKNDKVGTSDVVAYCLQGSMVGRLDKNGPNGTGVNENVSYTLNTTDKHCVTAVDCRNFRETEEISGTLQAKNSGGFSLNCQNPVRNGYIVRRLIPTECELLQGYPIGWTEYGHDGKPLCDTARYQALGNSVAIPCVAYVISGIVDELLNKKGE